MQLKTELVQAICKEISLQKDYLETNKLDTIYFGGGTPSLLTQEELSLIFETIYTHFTVSPSAEITFEANPDDLTQEKLLLFRAFPINRFSIGIQSFYEPHLKFLNRAHSAQEAQQCVYLTQDAGFGNISIDLIYAIPHLGHFVWEKDLQTALDLKVPHISSYCLTIEPKTAFGNWLRTGKLPPIDEEFSIEQFKMLMQQLRQGGFEQYEISNFALPGFYSRHNSNYWKKRPYLGIGPSAHSFNGLTRQYNISNNAKYVKALLSGTVPATIEDLSLYDQVNEYIMTSLRTTWGCNLQEVTQWSGIDIKHINKKYIEDCLQKKLVLLDSDVLTLTTEGKLLADQIASDLFIV